MAIFQRNSHGGSETTTGSNSKYAVLFHSRVRALMFQHTRKRPLAPNTNSNHKREYAGFFSLFHQIRSSSKEPYKMSYKKNDVLPHEPTRCNNVRQRETTKQVNISVVRRQTHIHDAQIAVVSQKRYTTLALATNTLY